MKLSVEQQRLMDLLLEFETLPPAWLSGYLVMLRRPGKDQPYFSLRPEEASEPRRWHVMPVLSLWNMGWLKQVVSEVAEGQARGRKEVRLYLTLMGIRTHRIMRGERRA